jgi:uncharacterized phage protein (TIGR02218 family)
MRNASAALIALINGGTQFYVADCLTIVRVDGTVHRFTSAPVDVTVESQYDGAVHTFSAGGVTFERGVTSLEVDDMALTLLTDPTRDTVTIGGLAHTWPNLVLLGYLDNATVMLERAFMATWGDTTPGTLILFGGRMGEMTPSRTAIVCTVKADLDLLELPLPRNIYQPACLHALFDSGCGLVRASFTATGTVQGGSTAASIITGLGLASGYYDLGALTITSGPNTGITRTVKAYASAGPGTVTLTRPFPSSDVVGRTFSMYPGCDKRQATCSGKFSNLARFRGYPYVPTPENAR